MPPHKPSPRQQSLFAGPDPQEPFVDRESPWDRDARGERRVATVILSAGPDREFDYEVPDRLIERVAPGHRIRVPLGRANRQVVAYCVAVATRDDVTRKLKFVNSTLDDVPLLSPKMIDLARWIAEHYLCSLGQVLDAIVPAAVRMAAGTRETTVYRIAEDKAAAPAPNKLSPKQQRVYDQLFQSPVPLTARQLAARVGCSQAPINALRDKGLIVADRTRLRTAEFEEETVTRESDLQLNPDQQAALDAITQTLDSGHHRTVLLHGVTGSGKTEVYIQAIRHVQSFGRQALVIVPEISLTPQTRRRFLARFDHVAVLHSHLSDAERHYHWQRIARGEVQVVVGARSAIFAPIPHLGLIVMDEEHETSFKQESTPRYHARDVALRRASAEDVPLVLGSATPSLESWYGATHGNYRLAVLPHRVSGRPLPEVRPIDLRDHIRTLGGGSLSRPLVLAMRRALEDDGQIILLLNRRGFATHIQCTSCGTTVECPNCDLALTLHRRDALARCHHCDYGIPAPATCPECKAPGLLFRGRGTQRLESEIRARFPDAPCLRMDTDSMQAVGSHDRALEAFRRGDVRILVGTQMIAKGLDFPNVTLVGVINADVALHLPDFRAAERTFQLLAQVAGRTGRGDRGGHVLVQTFTPDHPAILAAMRHDFHAFLKTELPVRKNFLYPPYGRMIRLLVQAENIVRGEQFATSVAEALRDDPAEGVRVLGPAPAPMPRLRDLHRFHVQVQSADFDALCQTVAAVAARLDAPDGVRLTIDVDPISML